MTTLTTSNAPRWGERMEYEQNDIAFALIKQLHQSFFKRDSFTLVEMEDTFCSASVHNKCQTRLLISGSVGNEREKAFLELIRRARFCQVSDLETNVQIRLQENDAIPHLWLAPLAKPCKRVRALLRWHLARTAMRCGMMRAILERREQTRERIRHMLENQNLENTVDYDDDTKYTDDKKANASFLTNINAIASSLASPATKDIEFISTISETKHCGNINHDIDREHDVNSCVDEALTNGSNLTSTRTMHQDLTILTTNEHETCTCTSTVEVICNSDTGADVHLKRYLPFEEFSNALRETNIDIAWAVNNVPTLLIAWSYRNAKCINWLRDNLFNDKVQKVFEKHKGLKTRVATLVGADPWVKLVESFIKLPQGKVCEQETFVNGKLCLFPRFAKRAQIILVNIDYDESKAAEVYYMMQNQLKNWKSEEVYLLSLWAGNMGGISEFAHLFHVNTLPHFTITSPAKRNHINYTVERPCVGQSIKQCKVEVSNETCHTEFSQVNVKVDDLVEHNRNSMCHHNTNCRDVCSETVTTTTALTQSTQALSNARKAHLINEEVGETYWHSLSVNDRLHLSTVVSDLITTCHIPMYFSAHISREFVLVNPYALNASKGLHIRTSSVAKMCGRALLDDLLIYKNEIMKLHSIRNFEFDVQLVKAPNEPLLTEFEPVTPLHSINNLHEVISCSYCHRRIKVQDESYYRCLHCKQCDGVVCSACARQAVPVHPEHHILLWIAANTTSEHMSLLWGTSNVSPLPLFCGKLVANTCNLHAGVYCNRCRFVIRGTRWKCALCFEYDLCDTCMKKVMFAEITSSLSPGHECSEEESSKHSNKIDTTKTNSVEKLMVSDNAPQSEHLSIEKKKKQLSTSRICKVNEFNTTQLSIAGHHVTHPMLQIRYATNEFADHMLCPVIISDLWSECQ